MAPRSLRYWLVSTVFVISTLNNKPVELVAVAYNTRAMPSAHLEGLGVCPPQLAAEISISLPSGFARSFEHC